jgi:hypothetical protein
MLILLRLSLSCASQSEGCVECNRAITAGVVEIPLSNGTTAVYHVACFKCKKCGVAINKVSMRVMMQDRPL